MTAASHTTSVDLTGPPRTQVTASGEAPGNTDCPFVQLTAARPAGGAAQLLVRSAPVDNGQYEVTFTMPRVEEPTNPPSLAEAAIVRAFCIPDENGNINTATSGQAEAEFRFTQGAASPGGAAELPRTGPREVAILALGGVSLTLVGAGLLLLVPTRRDTGHVL